MNATFETPLLDIIANFFSYIFGTLAKWISSITTPWTGIDFSILYNWLPSDLQLAITSVIVFSIFIAIYSLIARLLMRK